MFPEINRKQLSNIDIERSILARLLISESECLYEVVDIIKPDDFYVEFHKTIMETIVLLNNQKLPFDCLMVSDYIVRHNGIEKEDIDNYIGKILSDSQVIIGTLGSYCEIIKDLSVRRQIKEYAERLMNTVSDDFDSKPNDILNNAIGEFNSMLTMATNALNYKTTVEMSTEFIENFHTLINSEKLPFLTTGIDALDSKVFMEKQDLVVIAARPAMGKSALAQNIAYNISKRHGEVSVLFTLEMSTNQIMQRNISFVGNVDMTVLRTGKLSNGEPAGENEWSKIFTAINEIASVKFIVDETPQIDLGHIRSQLNKIRHEHGKIGTVVVDYLQLMKTSGGENRAFEIGALTGGLKALAKEFDCLFIVLAQLNRNLESRPSKRPLMSDLRESGAIEQDANTILFIYRDEVYNPSQENKGLADIIIGKQRQGEGNLSIPLAFEGKHSRFSDLVFYGNDDAKDFMRKRNYD